MKVSEVRFLQTQKGAIPDGVVAQWLEHFTMVTGRQATCGFKSPLFGGSAEAICWREARRRSSIGFRPALRLATRLTDRRPERLKVIEAQSPALIPRSARSEYSAFAALIGA